MAADAASYSADPMAEGFAEMDYTAPDTMQTSIDAANTADLADDFSVGEDLSTLGELGEGAEDIAGALEGADAVGDVTGAAGGGSLAGVGDLLEGNLEEAIKKQLLARSLAALGPWGAAAGLLIG